jgi:hypothetical protein
MVNKLRILFDNNILGFKYKDLKSLKNTYGGVFQIMVSDVTLMEMVGNKNALETIKEIRDLYVGTPQFTVTNDINRLLNKNRDNEKYEKIKALIKENYTKPNSMSQLLQRGFIFEDDEIESLRKIRDAAKEEYKKAWNISKPIIKKTVKEEQNKTNQTRLEILNDAISSNFFDANTFDMLCEKFHLKQYFFCDLFEIYKDKLWLKSESLKTYMLFYLSRAQDYVIGGKGIDETPDGADLLDIDLSCHFPDMDYFVTDNIQHFQYGICDEKILPYDQLIVVLNAHLLKLKQQNSQSS